MQLTTFPSKNRLFRQHTRQNDSFCSECKNPLPLFIRVSVASHRPNSRQNDQHAKKGKFASTAATGKFGGGHWQGGVGGISDRISLWATSRRSANGTRTESWSLSPPRSPTLVDRPNCYRKPSLSMLLRRRA